MKRTLALFHQLLNSTSQDEYTDTRHEFQLNNDLLIDGLVEGKEDSNKTENTKEDCEYALFLGLQSKHDFIPFINIPCLFQNEHNDQYRLRPCLTNQPTLLKGVINKSSIKKFGVCYESKWLAVQRETDICITDDWETWVRHALNLFYLSAGYHFSEVTQNLKTLKTESGKFGFKSKLYTVKKDGPIFINPLYKHLLAIDENEYINTPLAKAVSVYEGGFDGIQLTDNELHLNVSNEPTYLIGHMDEDTKKIHEEDTIQSRELHPLDNTQRLANYYISKIKNSEVLAVNGPPGSGKTAMLKAVIANQWVRAVIDEQPCPIILAVGDTNQSVTNVIGAFPSVAYSGNNQSLLHYKRWLPHIYNYGTYLPSSRKYDELVKGNQIDGNMIAKQTTDEHCIFSWKAKGCEVLTNYQDLGLLKKHYIDNANLYYSDCYSATSGAIEKVIKRLRCAIDFIERAAVKFQKSLIENKDNQAALLNLVDDSFINNKVPQFEEAFLQLLDLCSNDADKIKKVVNVVAQEKIRDEGITDVFPLVSQCQLILIDRLLDNGFRSEMFHLSARYWEGKYILECESEILLTKTERNIELALRRMCMLTPCLVSTLDYCPNIFSVYSDDISMPKSFLLNKVDLMIIDETGQAQIAKGLPVLSLAKKVVAVGDVLQLQPVIVDFDKQKEKNLFNSYQFNDQEFSDFYSRNLLNSNGSLLHTLREASAFSYKGKGLMLRGHYRCYEEIIQLCNEMVYDNQLFIAPFLKGNKPLFSPIAWVESSQAGQSYEGSRINKSEADLIVKFICDNWIKIFDYYGKEDTRISDIIGIVSPYTPQPAIIKAKLQEHIAENPFTGKYEISQQDIADLTSGTVNALQGAEKTIILFSSVKTAKDVGGLFFDNQPYLLNVALSRAKESFIAFLCPEEYGMKGALKESDEGELEQAYAKYTGQYLLTNAKKLFPTKLVVIEAPGKVPVIQGLLDCNYVVMATKGRTHEQCKRLSINEAQPVIPKYTIATESVPIVDDIITASLDMDEIIIATDNDNAGHSIGWHLANQMCQSRPALKDKIRHVHLSEITPESIKSLIIDQVNEQPQHCTPDEFIVQAELTREVVDCFIAQRFSKICVDSSHASSQIDQLINMGLVDPTDVKGANSNSTKVGRVKAGILSVINSITENRSKQVHATLKVNGKTLRGTVTTGRDEICDWLIEKDLTAYRARSERWVNAQLKKSKAQYSAPCTSTLNILKMAATQFGYSPSKTMELLQMLYEGSFYHDQ